MNDVKSSLLEINKKKDKYLLRLEIFVGVLVSIIFIISVILASIINVRNVFKILIIILGLIPFIVGVILCLRIEQIVGYYECNKCHYKYVPKFNSILWSMHICRTRYIKCPKCKKSSWNKKVI